MIDKPGADNGRKAIVGADCGEFIDYSDVRKMIDTSIQPATGKIPA
jgi:hypothetical protein